MTDIKKVYALFRIGITQNECVGVFSTPELADAAKTEIDGDFVCYEINEVSHQITDGVINGDVFRCHFDFTKE